MEADGLRSLIPSCPLRIQLNSGEEYTVEKPEFIMVGDYQAALLMRITGAMRTVVVGLMNISSVQPIGETAEP